MSAGQGYDAFGDPYCYKGTFVPKYKAGLCDAGRLEGFELEMSSLRAKEPLSVAQNGSASDFVDEA